jgi:hypothetical protein
MRWHASLFRPISILIFACLFSTSCFFYQTYPNQWAPREKQRNKDCWQILGTYNDAGETAGKKPQTVSLSGIIFGWGNRATSNSQDTPDGISVKIAKLTEDSMEISTWKDGKQEYARSYSRSLEEFSCSSKGISISQGRSTSAGEGYSISYAWRHLNLAINKEGSLVLEQVESGFGAFLLIPVVGGGSSWSMFKRLDTPDH